MADKPLFNDTEPGSSRSGDPFKDMRFEGPRRTIKVGGRIITERMAPPSSDEGADLDFLLRGISQSDLERGGLSGFGRFSATERPHDGTPRSDSYRGMPHSRDDGESLGEIPEFEEDSSKMSGGIPAIDFQRDPYPPQEYDQNTTFSGDSGDIGMQRDLTSNPLLEQSYRNDDRDDPIMGSTHRARLERMKKRGGLK